MAGQRMLGISGLAGSDKSVAVQMCLAIND